ncbi:MAG: tetraacyldisaccharide 4'-kinase [Gemmatimonadales bacterium]
MRRGDTHRFLRWLWTSRRLDARLLRVMLLPLAGLWWSAVALRNLRFDHGLLGATARRLPLPSVGVGNLSVGGSGKTPIASWIAQYYATRGLVPGVLTSAHGRDEALMHQYRVPTARVIADPDRVLAANRAREQGAGVVVLDDAFQLRGVARDLNLVVVSAETARAVRWPLPAGPWRESWSALRRADGLIITRKRAEAVVAQQLLERLRPRLRAGSLTGIARLGVARYEGLESGRLIGPELLRGAKVVAATAIADPESFVAQTKTTGALVQVATWPDHHPFSNDDVAWLAKAARQADYLVVTQKDAVKLRGRWPASVPEPMVALLDLVWERGEREVSTALDALVSPGARD